MEAPDPETLKGKRDRAILSTFLFQGLRREELSALKVKDIHPRRGVPHLRIHDKDGNLRYVRAHAAALEQINDYLEAAGHREDQNAPSGAGDEGAQDGVARESLLSVSSMECTP